VASDSVKQCAQHHVPEVYLARKGTKCRAKEVQQRASRASKTLTSARLQRATYVQRGRISVRQGRYECLQRDFSLSVWLWESMPPALHWGSGSELPETPTSSILTKQKTYSLARRVILAVPRVRFSSAAFLLNSSACAALTFISRHFRVARATASLIYDRSTCTEARRKMALLRIPLTTIADTQRGRSGVLCSSPALAARGGLLPVIRLD
jgi:hypothetical protein